MATVEDLRQGFMKAQTRLNEAEEKLSVAKDEEETKFWRERVVAQEVEVNKWGENLRMSTQPGNDFVTRALGT